VYPRMNSRTAHTRILVPQPHTSWCSAHTRLRTEAVVRGICVRVCYHTQKWTVECADKRGAWRTMASVPSCSWTDDALLVVLFMLSCEYSLPSSSDMRESWRHDDAPVLPQCTCVSRRACMCMHTASQHDKISKYTTINACMHA
jgi:hypothetical protein